SVRSRRLRVGEQGGFGQSGFNKLPGRELETEWVADEFRKRCMSDFVEHELASIKNQIGDLLCGRRGQ
ncbi:MAG TPA: hypothetical protein VLD18_01655, partial [Verrucomicrobiae bacterium]|nr:hypothetical protein [Verrucomicrobiae bacterium]